MLTMPNENPNPKDFFPSFGSSFLEDHARRIIADPEIALIEIVANCWDAGADKVEIIWPLTSMPDEISIEDNGTGMTLNEFENIWPQLNYNRKERQGDEVTFPQGNYNRYRKAFGRNGKGRHSMFCFANEYFVETWKSGEANLFIVKKQTSTSRTPFSIELRDTFAKSGHGTKLYASLSRNYIELQNVRDLIGSKFITDPTFHVFLNRQLIEFAKLEHLIDSDEIEIPGVGTITVSQVDTQATSRTSTPHGIAWWVNKRLVGKPSWKGFENFDRRTVEAKRYTFLIEADCLVNDVRDDWSGFLPTKKYDLTWIAVEKHIRYKLLELMKDEHKTQKKVVLEDNREQILKLTAESRYFIGRSIDGIQKAVPSIKENTLSATVNVLAKLENTRFGFELIEQLARLNPTELDQLYEILDKWSVQEALIVLSELDRRLKLIERLEALMDDPTSDELHDFQPLFGKGLWILGPEFESVHYTSNRTLLTVIKDLFDDSPIKPITNPRKRPDFVVLPSASVGVYASDAYDKSSEVDGFEKVIIIELKKGGSQISVDERRQGENYARELRKSGKVQKHTKIVVFVLGAEVSEDLEDLNEGLTTVYSRSYSVILRKAHARTFNLYEKIKVAKENELSDPEVDEVMKYQMSLQL